MITPPPATRRRHRKVHPAAARRAEYRVQRRRTMTFVTACAREAGAAGVLSGALGLVAVGIFLRYSPGLWVRRWAAEPSLGERAAAQLVLIVATVAAVLAVTARADGRNVRAAQQLGRQWRARAISRPKRGPDQGNCLVRTRGLSIGFTP